MASTQKRILRSAQNSPMRGQIVALAAGEFDVGEGDEPGAGIGGGFEDFFEGDVAGVFVAGFFLGDHDQLDAAAADGFHPGIDVGGVFDGGGDDAVAALPVDAVGDDADSFAGVFDEGDFVAMGIEKSGGALAQLFDVLIPVGAEIRGGFGLAGVDAKRFGGGMGERGDAGVIEKLQWRRIGKASAFPINSVMRSCHRL